MSNQNVQISVTGKADFSEVENRLSAMEKKMLTAKSKVEQLFAGGKIDVSGFDKAMTHIEKQLSVIDRAKQRMAGDKGADPFSGRAGNIAGNVIQNFLGLQGEMAQAADLALDGNLKAAAGIAGVGLAAMAAAKGIEAYIATVNKQREAVAMSATSAADYAQKLNDAGNVKFLGMTFNLQVYADIAKYIGYAAEAGGDLAAAQAKVNAEMEAGYAIAQRLQVAENANFTALRLAGIESSKLSASQRERLEAATAAGKEATALENIAKHLATINYKTKEWKDLTDTERDAMYQLAESIRKVELAEASLAQQVSSNIPDAFREAQDASYTYQMAWSANSNALTTQMESRNTAIVKEQLAARENAYKATQSKLEGMVAPMLGKSKVTQEDLDATASGKYVDKVDEDRRRLETIKLAPSIDHELIAKLPADMQAELRTAFETGGTAGGAALIDQMLNANAGVGDFRLYNADMIAESIAQQLAEAAAQKDLMKTVMGKLAEKGIDPNSPEVQKALGITPAGGAASPLAASMGAGAESAIADAKIAPAIQQAVANNAEGITTAGKDAGQKFGMAFVSTLTDTDFGFGEKLVKVLTGIFDGRYIRLMSGFVQ